MRGEQLRRTTPTCRAGATTPGWHGADPSRNRRRPRLRHMPAHFVARMGVNARPPDARAGERHQPSCLHPDAPIFSAVEGRLSTRVSCAGAAGSVSCSSAVVRSTHIALGWIGATMASGSVVREANSSCLPSILAGCPPTAATARQRRTFLAHREPVRDRKFARQRRERPAHRGLARRNAVEAVAMVPTCLRRSVPVWTLTIGRGSLLMVWLRRHRRGRRTTGGTQHATRQGPNGRPPAAPGDTAQRRTGACAKETAPDSALSRVVGVCAGRQPKSGNQGQAQQKLTIHGTFSLRCVKCWSDASPLLPLHKIAPVRSVVFVSQILQPATPRTRPVCSRVTQF